MAGARAWKRRSITYRWARRIAVSVIGGTLLLVGVAMMVLPGPALVVIPLALGVLGIEFAWARRWLRKVRATAGGIVNGVRQVAGRSRPPESGGGPA